MTVGNVMYSLIIMPLYLLFETIFSITNRFVHNPGITIIFLSIAVNILVFPLYRRADEIQNEERELEKRLKPGVDHIKETFKGDERYMMLQTYYRQNNYKPYSVLKGSLSLLLEIPFFIAAYRFLSSLQLLNGTSFGLIHNFGKPDGMLIFGGITVNVLPILMTAINFVSAAIYLKGFPIKSKIQTFGMALIFLVLLYNSPSGLVFYWTLNNFFSLLKNIFYKLKNPGKVLAVISGIIGIVAILFVLTVKPFDSGKKRLFICVLAFCLLIPLLFSFIQKRTGQRIQLMSSRQDDLLFLLGMIFMTILLGVLIPSSVIRAAPTDFINIKFYYSPLWYIANSLCLSIGTFILWFGVFYKMALSAGKKLMGLAIWIVAVCSIVNYMFFGTERGDMSDQLIYDIFPKDTIQDYLINIFVLLLVSAISIIIWKKKQNVIILTFLTISVAVMIMSIVNLYEIEKDLTVAKKTIIENNAKIPEIELSKSGKNVMIFMMDRSIGYLIPFLMEEKPEMRDQFDGFVFYPNTLSFSRSTNGGVPGVYGGYEYIPEKMNARSEEPLVKKHNEAMQMMPFIFDSAGYEVTVFDPSYANYRSPSDLHIYDEHPNIKSYNLGGTYVSPQLVEMAINTRNRNFFCFSVYKISPLILQPTVYTEGLYNEADAIAGKKGGVVANQTIENILFAYGLKETFDREYSTLLHLKSLTIFTDDNINTYTSMDNNTTHNVSLLQMPDYVPSEFVDNTEFDTIPAVRYSLDGRKIEMTDENQMEHYHINMAAYSVIGQWLDYLRENDVFDNTRIIIVADHGRGLGFQEHKLGKKWTEDVLFYNPVLMVKDFGSMGPFTVNEQFMTNAEVPTIAMRDLIENPINPATGNPVTNEERDDSVHYIYEAEVWDVKINNGNTFLPGNWYAVHGTDILDVDNWEWLGVY